MWKPFCNATMAAAPQAAILFDKFHIIRHLGEALDKVRKAEYARLTGKDRRFIKGQKYTLLLRRENLTLEGRRSLKLLLAANKRLNTAYILERELRPALELRARGLGTALLLQLAGQPQMAAPQTL
jgi:transposase